VLAPVTSTVARTPSHPLPSHTQHARWRGYRLQHLTGLSLSCVRSGSPHSGSSTLASLPQHTHAQQHTHMVGEVRGYSSVGPARLNHPDDFHPSVASYSLSQGRQLTWSRNTQLTLHVRGHVCIHCSVCPVRHHLEPHPPPSPPRRASCTPPHSSSTLLPSQPRTPVSARRWPQHRSMSPQPWPARRWIGFIRDTGTMYSQQGPGGAGKGEWVGGCSHRVDATDPGSPSLCCGGGSDHITQHHIMGVSLLPRPSQVGLSTRVPGSQHRCAATCG
jgi:hypothetical protein